MENSTTNNDEKSINTSMSLVNNITIDCLMNTSRYNKCKEYLLNSKNLEFNRDKKFYRKRIISLTKELFHNNELRRRPLELVRDTAHTGRCHPSST